MAWRTWVYTSILLAVGCTHAQINENKNVENGKPMVDARLAHADFIPEEDNPIQGVFRFEQMPNSVIVTFHVEGLAPQSAYQIYFFPGQECTSLDLTSGDLVSRLRANKEGFAENTFKTERFTISRNRALLGGSVVLRRLAQNAQPDLSMVPIACGVVEAGPSSRENVATETDPSMNEETSSEVH